MRPVAAWRALALLATLFAALLIAVGARYGYHRDELYFLVLGAHPAFGYVDEPPLVPLLAHAMDALGGHHLLVLRVPSALAGAGVVVLTGLIAREFGAPPRGQVLAAACMGASGTLLAVSHLMSTTTYDVLLWAAITLTLLRCLDAGRWRWLLLGGLAGVALEIKSLPLFLLLALAVGVVAAGPRRALWTPWLAAGGALAVALWLPNLIWQATHGWPQLELARALANGSSGTSEPRWLFLPMQVLQVGPPLAPFWIVGLVRLARDPRWRWLGLSWLVLVVAFLVTGGKPYYLAGFYPVLFAAGAEPVLRWARGRRRVLVPALVAASLVVSGLIVLPLVPVSALHDTPIVAIDYDAGETVGWPRFADTVAAVARRAHAPVVTGNYGEAGALHRYRPDVRAYGAQNSYWDLGRPGDGTRSVVAVGFDRARLAAWFTTVEQAATVDNGLDVDNDEQGVRVYVCTGPREAWPRLWRAMRHLG